MNTTLITRKTRCLAAVALLSIATIQICRADHGDPTAGTVDELIAELQADLDELAVEYGIEPGEQPNFDEPYFNRLVGQARIDLETARQRIDRGRICRGMKRLTRSVRRLDRATRFAQAQNMSGSGFSDDLASLTAARSQFFLEDLIVLAAEDPGVPDDAIDSAIESEILGDEAAGGPDSGDWEQSMRHYTRGVCVLMDFLP